MTGAATTPRLSVRWAMPNRWTFQIPPIVEFLRRHVVGPVIVDPFCGSSDMATHRNDIARGGIDAGEWCERLLSEGVVADCVIFDPPYSPRQIAECYREAGIEPTTMDTQNASLYARVRRPLLEMLRPGGVALSFGWQSGGFGKSMETEEIMLVQHGGAHNDTICVAQRKPLDMFRSNA